MLINERWKMNDDNKNSARNEISAHFKIANLEINNQLQNQDNMKTVISSTSNLIAGEFQENTIKISTILESKITELAKETQKQESALKDSNKKDNLIKESKLLESSIPSSKEDENKEKGYYMQFSYNKISYSFKS